MRDTSSQRGRNSHKDSDILNSNKKSLSRNERGFLLFALMQQIHKFLAGDGFLLQQEMREPVQSTILFCRMPMGLLMRGLDGGNHFLVNLRRGLRRAGERGIT